WMLARIAVKVDDAHGSCRDPGRVGRSAVSCRYPTRASAGGSRSGAEGGRGAACCQHRCPFGEVAGLDERGGKGSGRDPRLEGRVEASEPEGLTTAVTALSEMSLERL